MPRFSCVNMFYWFRWRFNFRPFDLSMDSRRDVMFSLSHSDKLRMHDKLHSDFGVYFGALSILKLPLDKVVEGKKTSFNCCTNIYVNHRTGSFSVENTSLHFKVRLNLAHVMPVYVYICS
jgi:hypothetical protein